MVQWLRLHAPNEGGPALVPHTTRTPMPQLRVHMLQLKILSATTRIKDPACFNYDAAAAKSLQSCPTLSHRRQPNRLLHPWDSPGRNTGVGCHFLLQCMKVKNESEVAQSCPTLLNHMDCSLPGSSVHEIFKQEYWSGLPLPSPTKMRMQPNK